MARLNINPTRMELSRLKKRLTMSRRGHKLLKDKRDEMMKRFLALVRETKELRNEVELAFLLALDYFRVAGAELPRKALELALTLPCRQAEFRQTEKKILSVSVPEFTLAEGKQEGTMYPYGFAFTTAALDFAVQDLYGLLPDLLRLASMEEQIRCLSSEIERTRRRVNALEHIIIPGLSETIRYIAMKLEENERGNITRLMKVKELMVKERLEQG
ncbi:MAG: V-type ATP synthase subunit D [Clostridia bacterium]|nr:V-type ATP synthase subunit D [Clostridia bacterium]